MAEYQDRSTQVIHPFRYKGELRAPASKSYFQRAMAIAALADDRSILNQISWANDTLAVSRVIRQLGADVHEYQDRLTIHPGQNDVVPGTQLDVGESGLALRMISSIGAMLDKQLSITGSGSLLERPVEPIVEAMASAGVTCRTTNGRLPIHFDSRVRGGHMTIDGSFSSQILTGLLISLPLLKTSSTLRVNQPKSTPYIAMTLSIMKDFGIDVAHENFECYHISGSQTYHGTVYDIEGDWSGAANHLVGAALSGEVLMKGLNKDSLQADRAILDALERYGAHVEYQDRSIFVRKNEAHPFTFDATHCPDLFPPLVLLASSCQGKTVLLGADRLKHKESDRLSALIDIFDRMGINITSDGKSMIVHGTGTLRPATIDSYNDHRIAMVAATAATICSGPITIERSNAVAKSYPHFFSDLMVIGD